MSDMQDDVSSLDPFDLTRFVEAQERVYPYALAEIRAGEKETHWMWYIFPQIDGLGFSSMAKKHAIKNMDEAKAYLAHPLLGQRLRECFEALLAIEGRSAYQIFDSPDDMKLRSCATLFASAAEKPNLFERILEKYYEGERDTKTLKLIGKP